MFCLKGKIFITAGQNVVATCGYTALRLLPERQDYYMNVLPFGQCFFGFAFTASCARTSLAYGYENLAFQAIKYNNNLFLLLKIPIIAVLFYISASFHTFAQRKMVFDKENIAEVAMLAPDKNKNGFEISVSVVAMFTYGSIVRDGFRLGAELTLRQHIGDWTISAGTNAYKESQRVGLGNAFAGFAYNDETYGAKYYCNKYFQGDRQMSGIVGVQVHDFAVNFEDDILALPFTGFVLHDRFRTAALELEYKNIILGTNVYTNEANGLRNASFVNSKGIYHTGMQLSSPVYAGYRSHGMVVRAGLNHPVGGFIGQNWWHRLFFDTTDFKPGDYRNAFFQFGSDKPYTLY